MCNRARFFLTLLTFAVRPLAAQTVAPENLFNAQIADSVTRGVFEHSYALSNYGERIRQAEARITQERLHWLSSLRVGVQFINLPGSQTYDANIGVIPALGASITLDLEGLATRKSRIRSAQAEKRIAENSLMEQKRTLRIWVEGKYFEYLQLLERMKLRADILQGQQEQSVMVKLRFERGEAKLEDLLNITAAINESRDALLQFELAAQRIHRELHVAGAIKEELTLAEK
jgi:outer membrane protein TolC